MQDPNKLPLMGISLTCFPREDHEGVVLEISSDMKSLRRLRKIVEASVEKIPLIFRDNGITVELKSAHPESMLDLAECDEPSYELIKTSLVGETNVGKTQLYERYLKGENYKPSYKKSIGVSMDSKKLNFGQMECNLQIWDVAGAERFANMHRVYLRETSAFILCVDGYRDPDEVFSEVKRWLNVIHDNTNDYDEPVVMLVDAKCDGFNKKVSHEQMEELAELLGIPFLACSAYKNINISVLFETVAKMALLKQPPKYKFSLYIKGVDVELLSSPDFYDQLNRHLHGCVELAPLHVREASRETIGYREAQLRVLDELIEQTTNEKKSIRFRK